MAGAKKVGKNALKLDKLKGPVIEAMFEDIPTTVFSNYHSNKGEERPKRSTTLKKYTGSSSTVSLPDTGHSSSSGLTSLAQGSPNYSIHLRSRTDALLTDVKGKTERISAQEATTRYRSKLLSYEVTELNDYNTVFYLGLGADKIAIDSATKEVQFDDAEHFYKYVPHDHIAYRYEICEKPSLGKGTFGQVLKAYDHKDNKYVALKIVRNEKIYLKQSREELKILQALRKQDTRGQHNVVHMYDFFMFRGHMVISFELLGMNLYQVLKRNRYKGLQMNRILTIGRALLKCLELLLKNRIIHCDIKPENIMLKRNEDFSSIKVGDFGSSCYEQQQVYHYIQSRYYRAPEVMLGLRYGPAIDMWSLGCVMAELANGVPLFVGNDEVDQLNAIQEVMGPMPEVMLDKMKSKNKISKKQKSEKGVAGSKPLETVLEGDIQFKSFVREVLEFDPAVRPTPSEMLQHQWLLYHKRSTSNAASHTPASRSSDHIVHKQKLRHGNKP